MNKLAISLWHQIYHKVNNYVSLGRIPMTTTEARPRTHPVCELIRSRPARTCSFHLVHILCRETTKVQVRRRLCAGRPGSSLHRASVVPGFYVPLEQSPLTHPTYAYTNQYPPRLSCVPLTGLMIKGTQTDSVTHNLCITHGYAPHRQQLQYNFISAI